MGQTITESEVAEIRAAAEGGDEVAKAALASLSTLQATKEPEEKQQESASAQKEEPKAEEKPEVKAEAKPEGKPEGAVEQRRESTGTNGRETMHPATARILRREQRIWREEMAKRDEEWQKRFDEIKNSQTPKPKETTEEDPLTLLLSKPVDFTDARINQRLEKFKQEQAQDRKDLIAQVRGQLKREADAEQAFKQLHGLEGFNAESETAADELVDFLSEKTGIDHDFLETMARQYPLKFAALAEKHWKDGRKLSESVQSDKKAASTGTAGGGKTGPSAPESVASLNARFAASTDKKEQEQILEKIQAVLYPK